MIQITSSQIYTSSDQLPLGWQVLAESNVLLSLPYLRFLENASPPNMTNYFIGLFAGDELQGIALAQSVDLTQIGHFGKRDHFITRTLRNFLFKNFSGQLFIVGNNLLTGSHAIEINENVDPQSLIQILKKTIHQYAKSQFHLLIWKDIDPIFSDLILPPTSKEYLNFKAQPNMVFNLRDSWNSMSDYSNDLSKKYRDQFKRCRKKGEVLTKKIFDLEDLIANEAMLYQLYLHVAHHAPFNTFFLPKNHFIEMKTQMGDHFRVCGYYLKGELIGFNSIIICNQTLETYFLGYNEQVQKDCMLYLNMLYDMLEFGIESEIQTINYGRTAMEIKSSIGAKAAYINSFMQHTNPMINRYLSSIYQLLEPKVSWKERHPFKLN